MSTQYAETEFQKLIVAHLAAHGWEVGTSDRYDRERALYPDDVLAWLALDDEKNLRKIVAGDDDARDASASSSGSRTRSPPMSSTAAARSPSSGRASTSWAPSASA
jgi:hypothetical protein